MPPATLALWVTRMPLVVAWILPAFVTEPATVLLLMVMPVVLGVPEPLVVRTPDEVLMTLPVTTAPFSTRMQLPVAELLLTVPTVPPFWMILQFCANADGAPPPISSAATEHDASSSPRPPRTPPPPLPHARIQTSNADTNSLVVPIFGRASRSKGRRTCIAPARFHAVTSGGHCHVCYFMSASPSPRLARMH